MASTLKDRLHAIRKPAAYLGGALVAVLLFLWLALPGILQSQAEAVVMTKTGHRLTMARPAFNPFTLRLQLRQLRLADPEDQPLLAFDSLALDLSAASLPYRALVFDAIELDGLALNLVEQPGGTLNWTPFLAGLQGKQEEAPPARGLPRLDIRRLAVRQGSIDFADRRASVGFATRIEPIDIELADLSSLPDDSGRFRITARTSFGAQVELSGESDLNPMRVTGSVSLQGLKLEALYPYLKEALPAEPAGIASLTATYRVGHDGSAWAAAVEHLEAKIAGLRVPISAAGAGLGIDEVAVHDGSVDFGKRVMHVGNVTLADSHLELPQIDRSLELAKLSLEAVSADLDNRQATLGRLALGEGKVFGIRKPDGRLPVVDALQALAARPTRPVPAAATPAAGTEKPWRFSLKDLELADWSVMLRDESVSPPATFAAEKIALRVADISDNLSAALPVRLALNLAAGGSIAAEGRFVPAGPAADFKLQVADVALKPVEPYLQSRLLLDIAGGRVSLQGQASFDSKAGPRYRGDFALRDLRLNEAGTGDTLLAWKQFGTSELTATAQRLEIGELRLNGLDTKLIIDKDKNINLKKVVKPAVVPAAPVADDRPAQAAATPPFLIKIDRLRFYNGEMYFADHSLVLPFGTRIHHLRGSVNRLSTQSDGVPGQMELEGEVDEYGMARAVGQVDLFDPTRFMDVRLVFKNVEMPRLTPYTATFAGRRIETGKLSLDLQYKLKQRQLVGENQLVIDRLSLGERVESSSAKDLPLDLAIAILQDSDGRIELGLPVTGNLDDPQFSYGAIVWKAITNVLTKIVTAPFRALASLFGGSEKIDNVAFEAGAGQLTPPEREKLVRLAEGLAKRPGLMLSVGGLYADADRVALQDVQLRRTIMTRLGQRTTENWDPGALSTQQPEVREQLEKLFAERIGASDLAALKEGFRKANPGQLEESMTGKMMSRLSGLLREKKTLGDDEVAQLKGADFHALLYERVRAREAVGDDRLTALAQTRGEGALALLKNAGAPTERLRALPAEKAVATEDGIPLKLAFEAGK